jgi:hypothetical protein
MAKRNEPKNAEATTSGPIRNGPQNPKQAKAAKHNQNRMV